MDSNFIGSKDPERRGRRKGEGRKREKSRQSHLTNDKNTYNLSWPTQSMLTPRLLSNGDPSFAAYPLPIAYPVESYPYSVYPQVYQTTSSTPIYPVPPVRRGRRNQSKNNGIKKQNIIPDHEYASLPPTNCDAFSDKSTDSDSNSKRHFSDPGIGPASSVESISLESAASMKYINLTEEMQYLKDNLRRINSDILGIKSELTDLKTQDCSKCKCSHQPGYLADIVGELKAATAAREEALFLKVDSSVKMAALEAKKGLEALTDRLCALESKVKSLESKEPTPVKPSIKDNEQIVQQKPDVPIIKGERITETEAPDAFMMLYALQKENVKLETNLQQAMADRNEADANTQKLERLVSILRTKIKELSSETSLPDDQRNGPSSAANTIEKNPFIVMDSMGKSHTRAGEERQEPTNSKVIVSQIQTSKSSNSLTSKALLKSGGNSPSVPTKPSNLSHLPKPTHPPLAQKPSNSFVTTSSPQIEKSKSDKIEGDHSNSCGVELSSNLPLSAVPAENSNSPFSETPESSTDTGSSNGDSIPSNSSLGSSIIMTGPVTHL